MRKAAVVTMVLAVFWGAGASSKTWYVYPGGVGGNAPTIKAAVDSAAVSGDNIMLKGGVYREQNIVIDGKAVLIDQFEGQAYLHAPSPGSGTGITIRNVPAGFNLNSIAFRGFETAVSIESSSGYVQWISIRGCGSGIVVSGASSAPTAWYSLVDSCATGMEIRGGAAATVRNQTIAHCETGISLTGGTAGLSRSILYACMTGVACSGGAANLSCNNFFNNVGDYSGCAPGTGDFYSDPMFCFRVAPSPGLYWLHISSPCYTAANPCGQSVGAFTAAAGCTGTAVETATWGAIKAMYR